MDKTKLLAGVFVLIGLFGAGYYVADTDQANLYQCEDIVGLCFKLSKVNDAGLQTRCYYNSSSPTKYKNCKTGWVKSELVNITGTETILPDYESFQMKYDFTTKQEAEIYITNLKQDTTYDWKITEIQQQPYSDILEVFGIVRIIKKGEIIDELGITDIMSEAVTKEQIESRMSELASESFENWQPWIVIDRKDKIM